MDMNAEPQPTPAFATHTQYNGPSERSEQPAAGAPGGPPEAGNWVGENEICFNYFDAYVEGILYMALAVSKTDS